MNKTLLTTKEAASMLGVSTAFLERDRCERARIPFIRLGTRSIRYKIADLETFLDAQTFSNTRNKKRRA